MTHVWRLIPASLALALALVNGPAAAQELATATLLPESIPAVAVRVDSARKSPITLPAVTASGAPRSYQVVSIPVPDALTQSPGVEVEIIPRGEFVVLGPRTRSLVTSAGRKGHVTLTIGIPAGALAGRLVAAEARFSSSGSAILVVPVEIDISIVRQLVLRAASTPLTGRAGDDIILPFEIVNLGNVRETVAAALSLPNGWASRELRQSPIAIEPGATAKRKVRIVIATLSSTGSSFIRVDLQSQGETVDSATIRVEVFNAGSIGRQAGPQILSAVSHATDENGRPSSSYSLTASGALFDSVRVDARMSHASPLGAAASNIFARMGTFNSSPSAVFSAPSGQLSLGNTGTSFSELTGLYPYGQGALLHLRKPNWELLGLGALSMEQAGAGRHHPMVGVRGERRFGDIRLSSSISHLADAGPSPRRLDAFGIGAAVPSLFSSTLKVEIAERRFDSGRGFGWSSEMVRMSARSSEQLRITQAPGGSDAFARATNEMIANVSERLSSRSTVSASAWRTADATSVFSGLKSSGFSLRPQFDIGSTTSLALEARSYLFDATSRVSSSNPGGAFGTRESQLGVSFTSQVRQFYLNTSAFLGNVMRTVTPTGQGVLRDRSPRNSWTTSAGWAGAGGVVEVQTRIEQTRDRGGLVNQQNLYGIRGEQVVLPWLGGIKAEGDLQRVHGFGSEKSAIIRGGITVPLINGLAVKFDTERNSIFRSKSGRTPWILGARIEHTFMLPMIRTPGRTGYVYQDLNGNQRRDRGEPGVAGAIVRRGPETSVADNTGKYRVGGDAGLPIVVDETSLPEGWAANGSSRGDLGVSLSRSAVIELIVAPRSGISAVEVDLGEARAIARDSAGREWSARMTGPSTATFDALPVGTYTLEFDLSQLSEPLVPRGPIPALVLDGTEARSLTITLDPRPIRMWTPSNRGGAGSNTPKERVPGAGADAKSTTTPTPGNK